MRTAIYIKERIIGSKTLAMICSFLNITEPTLNSKLTEEKIALFDNTINSDDFLQWFLMKLKIDKIEDDRAESLIKLLRYDSIIEIDELLAERIINALEFKIGKWRYSIANRNILQAIIDRDSSQLEKIKQLKETVLFAKPIVPEQPEEKQEINNPPRGTYPLRLRFVGRHRHSISGYDKDSEEAIMWAIQNGYGDLYGLG